MRQASDADDEADDRRGDDAGDGNENGVQDADDERPAVGRIARIGDQRLADFEACAPIEKCEARCRVAALQVDRRIVSDPRYETNEQNYGQNLEKDAP